MDNAPKAIHTLHWGPVPQHIAPEWCDENSTLFAVWPAPHNADYCLRRAGFTDFDDPDTPWDSEWFEIVERAIGGLAAHGPPRMREPVEVFTGQERSLLERLFRLKPATRLVELSIVEQVELLTHDDQFPPAVVDFGDDASVTLRACSGHAILWTRVKQGTVFNRDAFLATLANGRPIKRMDLDWKFLVP